MINKQKNPKQRPQPCEFAWQATRWGLAPRRHAPGLVPPHCGQVGITAILIPAQPQAHYFSGIGTPTTEFCSPQSVQALVGWQSHKRLYLHPASRTGASHGTVCRATGEELGFGHMSIGSELGLKEGSWDGNCISSELQEGGVYACAAALRRYAVLPSSCFLHRCQQADPNQLMDVPQEQNGWKQACCSFLILAEGLEGLHP